MLGDLMHYTAYNSICHVLAIKSKDDIIDIASDALL